MTIFPVVEGHPPYTRVSVSQPASADTLVLGEMTLFSPHLLLVPLIPKPPLTPFQFGCLGMESKGWRLWELAQGWHWPSTLRAPCARLWCLHLPVYEVT